MADLPKIPEIKPEVNKEKEEDRQGGGGLLGLLSRLGGGSASSGVSGGIGGAGLIGGLMATKAGIIALVLAGTTVAGGIGMVGYKVFGPGPGDRMGGHMALFEPRPAPSAQVNQSGGGSKDGSSTSLQYLSQANVGSGISNEAANEAAAKAAAEAAAAQQATVGNGQNNNANPGNNLAGLLPGAGKDSGRKLTELAKPGAGGATSGASAAAAAPVAPRAGTLTGFSSGSKGSASGNRGFGTIRRGVGGGGGMGDLRAVHGDSIRATDMRAAGRTIDGGGGGGGGPRSLNLGGAGVGGGGAGAMDKPGPSNSNTPADQFPAPPEPNNKNGTPWQGLVNKAAMLIVVAAALLYAAAKIAAKSKLLAIGTFGFGGFAGSTLAYVLAGIAAVLGVMIMQAGAQIAGHFEQSSQGMMFQVAGGAIIAASAATALAVSGEELGDGSPTTLMYLCGAVAIGAAIWGYMGH